MLSISVAVYNLPDITRQCFDSLIKTVRSRPFEVLVHDNHSTDPAMDALYRSLDPAIFKVCRAATNEGYKGAHRANAARANGEWFVIINNDIIFDEPGWDRKFVLSEGIGAIGLRGEVCNAIRTDGTGYYDPRCERSPMYIDGHMMAIPREVLLKEGLFEDEGIQFCYFEDADHSMELLARGYRLGFVPVGLRHFRGSTSKSLGPEGRLKLRAAFEQNRARFLSKWSGKIAELRSALRWEDVPLVGCPERTTAPQQIPRPVADLISRALTVHRGGKLKSAEELYIKAIRAGGGRPVAEAEHLLAILRMDTGRDGLEHARKAVQSSPGNAAYLSTLGNAEQQAGHAADAFRAYLCAIRLNPRDDYALYNLGRLCQQLRMNEEAAEFYRRTVALNPSMADAHYGLGRALADMGRPDEAAPVLEAVVAALPGHADAALELSIVYRDLKRYDDAERVLRAAIPLNPNNDALHNNLGVVLIKKGEPASEAFSEALRLRPDNPEFLTNMGMSFMRHNDVSRAIEFYRRAVALSPDYADAHWNLAIALLLNGAFKEGWSEYRWGMMTTPPRSAARVFDGPQWDGSPGKAVLIYAEQGYGDTFQLVRYARVIKDAGAARVILECQPGLGPLLRDVPGADQVVERGGALPAFDSHVSLFDLPRLMHTMVETIPSECGYIRAARADKWAERMIALKGRKVGIAWQGRATHGHDHLRSISLYALAPLLDVEGITFISLQKGHGQEQIRGSAFDGEIIDYTAEFDADGEGIFLDAAGIIANLDLVITVDSAIAHLAGAMGASVWTLLQFAPDWRWMLGREDSPWYPSMRLVRQQSPGDWPSVIARVKAMLGTLK